MRADRSTRARARHSGPAGNRFGKTTHPGASGGGGSALLGICHGGIEAGHEHRNLQWQPRAAPYGMLCISRKAHRVSRQKILRPESVDVKDRKSTRLNSSHTVISYAVFCLKKKKSMMRSNIGIFITIWFAMS